MVSIDDDGGGIFFLETRYSYFGEMEFREVWKQAVGFLFKKNFERLNNVLGV